MIRNGFTLVETLVSLVAGGLLLGSISYVIAGLGDDLRSYAEENGDDAVLASGLLETALANARFAGSRFEALTHSSERLTFIMPAPLALERRGYVEASLFVRSLAGSKSLVLQSPDNSFPPIEILSNQQAIDIAYEPVPDTQGEFLQKITITHRAKVEPLDRQIVIRPRINGRGACVFDVISQRCRS